MVVIKDKLKVKIVEENNEVLPIFIRDIEGNLKTGEDVALVRFDAFADFLVPNDVQADEIETSSHSFDSISNQSWILPAVYRGHIKKIFWFKPPWAHQFLDGVYQIQVGKCQQTGLLKVASTYPYFTSNCLYSSSDKLLNLRTVDVYISTTGLAKNYSTKIEKEHEPIYDDDSGHDTTDSEHRKKVKLASNESNHTDPTNKRIYPLNATILNQLLENRSYFLDIDLSFFSTDDPIRKQFDENEYEVLRYVYQRIVHEQSESEILQYMASRESALEQISSLMNEYLSDSKADQQIVVENLYLSALIAVIRYKKLDWKSIHQYGTHLSDTRPPLHVSSEGMIIYLVESMSRVLQSIKKEPVLITVARCVNDGFCSYEQANLIQLYVEQKVRRLYKVEEILGKTLSMNDEDDYERHEEKSSFINDSENLHRMKNEEKFSSTDSMKINKTSTLKSDSMLTSSSSMNTNHRRSPSPSKSNLSPGEIKAISPSSLSDSSPI